MKKQVINPKFKELPVIPRKTTPDEAREINWARGKYSKDNIGTYFSSLYQSIFGGRVMRTHEMYSHLFPLFEVPGEFYPDVARSGKDPAIVEVKAISLHNSMPWFGFHQIAAYLRGYLGSEGEMYAAIFNYGKRESEKLHICGHDSKRKKPCINWEGCGSKKQACLVDRLSESTNNLIVLPHNLLTFLLGISKIEKHDQTNSNSVRDAETYYRIYGTWLTLLRENYQKPTEAIEMILASRKLETDRVLKTLPKPEDFLLNNLKASQIVSPNNLSCKGRKIEQFPITIYANGDVKEWKAKILGDIDRYTIYLGIHNIFHKIGHEPNEKVMINKPEEPPHPVLNMGGLTLPEKPKDDIPF